MSVRNLALAAAIGALLPACASNDKSPIYTQNQNTTYKIHSPYPATAPATQQATYSANSSAPTISAATPVATTTESLRYGTPVDPSVYQETQSSQVIATGTIVAAEHPSCDYFCEQQKTSGFTTSSTNPYVVGSEINVSTTSPDPSLEVTTAPTDQAYGETFGTPGYHALHANGELDGTMTASTQTPIAAPSITAPTIPQANFGANPMTSSGSVAESTIGLAGGSGIGGYPVTTPPSVAAPVTTPTSDPYSANGMTMHRVVEGDTVYALSRRLCVDVDDIKSLNSLNTEFYIRLDDLIKLPASRC
ncbi:MAG: LysM peptidoglycan-binding domain-containing protein [Hellea sp.]|nr:LysM peptidoglycan-binding domain-containing protein [Hellea sp.]